MLTIIERAVRQTLIRVYRGEIQQPKFPRRIGYKALWKRHSSRNAVWNRGKHLDDVVKWIIHISNYDEAHNPPCPPLNSIVIRLDTGQPGKGWKEWNMHHRRPYSSITEAQNACWAKWPETHSAR